MTSTRQGDDAGIIGLIEKAGFRPFSIIFISKFDLSIKWSFLVRFGHLKCLMTSTRQGDDAGIIVLIKKAGFRPFFDDFRFSVNKYKLNEKSYEIGLN